MAKRNWLGTALTASILVLGCAVMVWKTLRASAEDPSLASAPDVSPAPPPLSQISPEAVDPSMRVLVSSVASDPEDGVPSILEDAVGELPPSLHEQVEEILQHRRDPGIPEDKFYRNPDKLDDVSRNPRFNPDGKVLTMKNRIELARLVKRQNERFDNAGRVYKEAHLDAAFDALERHQYIYIEMGKTVAENLERVTKAKESLSLRFGKELKDWRTTQTFRSSTDGESWIVLVWYTARQHPEPFETADDMLKVIAEKDQSYRQFFADLR